MSFSQWLKEESVRQTKGGITSTKIAIIFTVIYLGVQFVSFLLFMNSLSEHIFWIVVMPFLAATLVTIIYMLPKRNNPH